ncbi:MAG: WYL domain-containing protein [Acidiferrobacterales bacterium]
MSGDPIKKLKKGVLQRLRYIEVLAYYSGLVTRTDVARAFGISDAAATKDLNLYGQLAPDNLAYKHALFGFVPTPAFLPIVADLDPEAVLSMMAGNMITPDSTGQPSLYGIPAESLPLPLRLPPKEVLAEVTRAIKGHSKCRIRYHSLTDRDSGDLRIFEPHSLVNTGLRWHVRGYNEDTFDFRDFVLSRITEATQLDEAAESSEQYDDDWVESATLVLSPHPDLPEQKRKNLALDYGSDSDTIELTVRRALAGYLLQRLAVDTTRDHSMNANAYQLVIRNRDEVEPFAGWAFL